MVSLFWGSSGLAGLLEFGLGGFLVSQYLDSQCLELMCLCVATIQVRNDLSVM